MVVTENNIAPHRMAGYTSKPTSVHSCGQMKWICVSIAPTHGFVINWEL